MDESFWIHGVPESFRLKNRLAQVTLDGKGVNHPRSPRGEAFELTPYEEVTHVAVSERGVWLGAKRSVYVLSRDDFVDRNAPERMVEALLRRIGEREGGEAQLERMARVEERAQTDVKSPATFALAALCVGMWLLQLLGGLHLEEAGYFSADFVELGDWWRMVTWNFLHAGPTFPLHLVMNLLGLLALGAITERSIGTAPTIVVLGTSAIGATIANFIADYWSVVGVSGVVFGLLGAVFYLDYARADVLPAWWRIPRRALWVMAIGSAVLALLPIIAGWSHFGGFIGGVAGTWWVSRGSTLPRPKRFWVRGTATACVAASVLSLGAAAGQLLAIPDYVAFHVARMVEIPDADPYELNNRAWFIAIDPEASDALRETALLLAERAVSDTEFEVPAHLDTLAELQFQLGFERSAIDTIDQALAITPRDRYLIEQRRRFIGERERDDPIWNPKRRERISVGDAERSA